MQSNDADRDELNPERVSPPVVGTIPESVVEAMRVVMQEAHKAASVELDTLRAELASERSALETERRGLEQALNEAQAAVAAEQAAHQKSLAESEMLRKAGAERDALQQRCAQLESKLSDLTDKDANHSKEQARLNVEHSHLASELEAAKESLAATEKRRIETAERLKKAQLDIYTLKAEVGDLVAELKRLKRTPVQPEPPHE